MGTRNDTKHGVRRNETLTSPYTVEDSNSRGTSTIVIVIVVQVTVDDTHGPRNVCH